MISQIATITPLQPDNFLVHHRSQEQRDLVILKYMARKVSHHFQLSPIQVETSFPLRRTLEERREREHHTVIFNPAELVKIRDFAFVGFVGTRQQAISSSVYNELLQADRQLVAEISHMPGFLGYASLELRPGLWYNLVVLEDYELKSHLLGSEAHKYAAHQLAPRYYDWIRLHSGVIRNGLASGDFVLQRTKFYHFPGGLQAVSQASAVQPHN
ncbi:hypothetical protein [Tengunoibacter tsumagoiensis]|uniref:Uncharacterized protein n=1 Tax=Tengunoibacter tsumagoiensis TaxID=2014871 RepID=A0A402A6F0_9CHLR|nr:hypothetical protein [Tengunoibacter tsumagoiensis]GCE14669.1 hypothetical protein KTT_45280 [Tengunoibacter tsumagoiensis]